MNKKIIEHACCNFNKNMLNNYMNMVQINQLPYRHHYLYYFEENQLMLPIQSLLYKVSINQNNCDKQWVKNSFKSSHYLKKLLGKTLNNDIAKYKIKSLHAPIIKYMATNEKYYVPKHILQGQNCLFVDTEFYYPWNNNYSGNNAILNTYELGVAFVDNGIIETRLFSDITSKDTARAIHEILIQNKITHIMYHASVNDRRIMTYLIENIISNFNITYINTLPVIRHYIPNCISYKLSYLYDNLCYHHKKVQFHQADQDSLALLKICQKIALFQ